MAREIVSIEPADDSQPRHAWIVFTGVFVGWQRNLRKDFGDAELNLREGDGFPPNRGCVFNGGLRTTFSLYERKGLDNCKRRIFRQTSCFPVLGLRA